MCVCVCVCEGESEKERVSECGALQHLRTPAFYWSRPLSTGVQHLLLQLPRTMVQKVTVTLLLWASCAVLIPNCAGQETFPTPAVNCSCELGHGKCAEDGECRCEPGWGGPFCADCVRMPGCVHGSCHQPWQCTCEDGWTGRFCDKDVHVCERERPCQNNGTCFLTESGEYNCLCPEGFHGKNCELKTGPCHKTKSPCKNGGLCEDLGGYARELSCRCLVGFTGSRCETNMDDCLMRPCANGATCQDGVNRFWCLCPAGFTGRFCTVNLDDCISQPCLNGGRCIDRVNAFHCQCPHGYTGRTCEVPLRVKVPQTQAPHRDFGLGEGGAALNGFTSNKPDTPTLGNRSKGITSSGGEDRLLKISVKEVVTQNAVSGLSEEQLITVLVLGGLTLAVVALTAGLVLRGHCQAFCACSQCRTAASQQQSFQQCCTQQHHLVSTQQDCKISFLHAPAPPPELEKKRLNTEVI